jgi:hypothetical protein
MFHHSSISRPLRRVYMAGWLALALSLLSTGAALAHPLGNFTINRYSRIELANEEARLLYIVDMAEIPTFRLRSEIDANGDGVIDPQEQALYANQLASNLQENLQLTVNAQNIALDLDAVSLEFPPGQANLPTLRFQAHFRAALPQAAQNRLEFVDANYAGQLGWQEVIIRAAQSVELLQTSAPSVDRSNELRNYPSDLLNNPPAVHNAQVEYRLAFSGRAHNNQGARQQTDSALQSISETALALGKPADGFANLIGRLCLGRSPCPLPRSWQGNCRRLPSGSAWYDPPCDLSGVDHHDHAHGRRLCAGHGDTLRLALYPAADALSLVGSLFRLAGRGDGTIALVETPAPVPGLGQQTQPCPPTSTHRTPRRALSRSRRRALSQPCPAGRDASDLAHTAGLGRLGRVAALPVGIGLDVGGDHVATRRLWPALDRGL